MKTTREPRSTMASPYMEFAKLHTRARFNLATSGIESYPLSELPVALSDLEINGPTYYGYEPLNKRLAAKSGVDPDCVVAATGCSLSNHLAMAATTEPGDEILIEHPTYELLTSTARFLGLEVRTFERRPEYDFKIGMGELERRLTPKTKLIVLTNLHNPSGMLTEEDTLRQVGALARSVGARVMVDEVYLDLVFDRPWRSAFHLSNQDFVVTTSLTKAYGLSGLRCGWILAEPDLARRIWRMNDLYAATPVHIAELLSVIALDNLEKIAARAKTILAKNRPVLNAWLDSRKELRVVKPEFGTVVFPRLLRGSVDQLSDLLSNHHDTAIAPGRFFEMPQHFRLGIGSDTVPLSDALERVGKALDEIAT